MKSRGGTGWGVALWALAGLGLMYGTAYGLAESTGEDGSNAQAVHALGVSGSGLRVGLISAGNARSDHEAFKDPNGETHLFCFDSTDEHTLWTTSHDTWMAGVVGSRGGAAHPNDIGVAPGVEIYSAKVTAGAEGPGDPNRILQFEWLEEAVETLVVQHACRAIVTGISPHPDIVAPNGDSEFTLLYDYYAFNNDVTFAIASGNIADRITVFGDAYNGITTGGLILNQPSNEYVYRQVGSKSGSGTTDDYRRKPEVVGPSQNQTMPHSSGPTAWYTWTSTGGETSFSAPHTAGVAALLYELADSTAQEPDDGHNVVIKAVMVNSAFPNIDNRSGESTEPANPNNVWHSERGYGRVDALRAYQTLAADRIHSGQTTSLQRGWVYESMTDGYDEHSYYFSGAKNQRLIVTVTWNREVTKTFPHGNYVPEGEPAFNIDLTVKGPSEQILSEEDDALNNLVKTEVILPADGTYHVHLANTTSQVRSYGFAFELLDPVVGDIEPNYAVDYADLAIIKDQWLSEGESLDADLWPDFNVDMKDFSVLAGNWLAIDERYCTAE